MNTYNNLNDKIKPVFITKLLWSLLMLTSVGYCIITMNIDDLTFSSWFLLIILVINSISLIFSITDIWVMVNNDEQNEYSWIFYMIYIIYSINIPIAYYTYIGVSFAIIPNYKIVCYEFAIILVYSIIYGILISWMIISYFMGIIYSIIKEIRFLLENNNKKNDKLISTYTNQTEHFITECEL